VSLDRYVGKRLAGKTAARDAAELVRSEIKAGTFNAGTGESSQHAEPVSADL
jgi:hypothetical protein